MPINVICPGCHARFQVSDKYAGQTGACPKCKAPIRVPTKDEAVTVHAPEEFSRGGRGATGKLILKPIAREKTKFSAALAGAVVAGVAVVFVAAGLGGGLLKELVFLRAAGLLLISFPLVWSGYLFLRDSENLEPYTGRPLWIRTAICAAAYAALWGVFEYVAPRVVTDEVWSWLFIAPPLVVVGALASLACYDLDFGSGAFHYAYYMLITILLRGCAGLGWVWQIGEKIK